MSVKHWLLLSRIPFMGVTVAPYCLGGLLSWRLLGKFDWTVFSLGLVASLLLQVIAHYNGELYDLAEDRLSLILEKNFFSGGSQVLVEKLVPQEKVRISVKIALISVLIIGAVLQFYFKTGPWTLPLGISGLFCAYFYSKPPLRLVSRGLGELLIAYCFGWLAVNASLYLQSSGFNFLASMVSLAIAATVVNIILINEYPDYPADLQTKKKNLLVRIGKQKGSWLYCSLSLAAGAFYICSLVSGLTLASLIFYFPVFGLSLFLSAQMLQGAFSDRKKLELMCGLTILVNLGTCISFILGLFFK